MPCHCERSEAISVREQREPTGLLRRDALLAMTMTDGSLRAKRSNLPLQKAEFARDCFVGLLPSRNDELRIYELNARDATRQTLRLQT